MIPPNFVPVALSDRSVPSPKHESTSAQSEAPRVTRAKASPKVESVKAGNGRGRRIGSKMVKKFGGGCSGGLSAGCRRS